MTSPRQPRSIPQVRNGRSPEEYYNTAVGDWLPQDCPFGNLESKQQKIILRVDEANRKIASAFEQWRRASSSISSDALSRHHVDLESAVFMLRRVADELIWLHSVLSHLEEQGRYPERIGVDCVGALLKHGSTLNSVPYRGHQETLRTLNDINNAHRHTFIDASLAIVGGQEPVICALALRRDKRSLGPKLFHVAMRPLVEEFDGFYNDVMAWLRGWSQRHLPKVAA